MIESKKYRKWITTIRKKNGEFIEDGYAGNCETSLNTLFELLGISDFYGKKSTYEIEKSTEFALFEDVYLKNNTMYIAQNKKSHHRYSNAVKFYRWYLKELESNSIDDPLTSVLEATEGRRKQYYTTIYERNPKLRKRAIEIHSPVCCVCNFNFEEKYGVLGKNYIEVHHTKPLYSLLEEITVNPATDLVCVCSNCHRMIHRKKGRVLTVDELKTTIENNKES